MAGAHAPLTGGCQCGAVRYEWLAQPEHTSICHCRMCQKASGQPFMGLAGGKRETLRFTRGEPTLFRSSNFAERGFCNLCGTPLTYAFEGSGEICVAINSLDDPNATPPTRQFGMESKVAWLDTIHTLPGETSDTWLKEKTGLMVSRQHPDED